MNSWNCGWWFLAASVVGVCAPSAFATRYYVDGGITSSGAGTSWATAKKTLQEALSVAGTNDEIWVADGTYYPTAQYQSLGAESVTFLINDAGQKIYGGFQGLSHPSGGESSLTQRNISLYQTILSGNVGSRTVATDNAWTVVRIEGSANEDTLIDGFIIQDGYNDDDAFLAMGGAGISVDAVSARIVNCTIRNCVCDNGDGGGGILLDGSSTVVEAPRLVNVSIVNNSCTGSAGGIFVRDMNDAVLVNCVIANNASDINGGGLMHSGGGDVTLLNCTIAGNDAAGSGGGLFQSTSATDTTLTNCIVYDNKRGATDIQDEAAQLTGASISVSYSCIEGLSAFSGNENIGSNPGFINLAGNDVRLSMGSPAADRGLNQALPTDLGDLDLDTDDDEPLPFDAALKPRRGKDPAAPNHNPCVASRVDMGAFENLDCNDDGVFDSSFSDTNEDGVADGCQNCDGAGELDPVEIALGTEEDCNLNGVPDSCDISSGCVSDVNEDDVPDSCTCQIDIVFLVDTSGSRAGDDGEICTFIQVVETQLAKAGRLIRMPARFAIFTIPSGEFGCLSTTVPLVLGTDVPGTTDTLDQIEDWGPAIAIIAEDYAWISDSRGIVVVSDEAPQDGDPCEATPPSGADYVAAVNAYTYAAANNVVVYPIAGSGADSCVTSLMSTVAAQTGGTTYAITGLVDYSDIDDQLADQITEDFPICPGAPPCPADLNDDCSVTGLDLAILLGQWSFTGDADLNHDGVVNGFDLALLLGAWGACNDCN